MPKTENPEATGNLSFIDLGLHSQTLAILNNKLVIPKDITEEFAALAVPHYANLLYPDKVNNPNFNGWVLDAMTQDIGNLAYLVTTPEGQQFSNDYLYLHKMAGILFAHHKGGNPFMVRGGKRYINQFPNEYHIKFIQQLISSPKIDELDFGIEIFGGKLQSDFRVSAIEYLLNLGEIQKIFDPAEIRIAKMFGMPSSGMMFLSTISPEGSDTQEPIKPIARVYKQNAQNVRDSLIHASKAISNPGFVLEILGDKLESASEWYFDTHEAIQLINLIRSTSGDLYPSFQKTILDRIEELKLESKIIPDILQEVVGKS